MSTPPALLRYTAAVFLALHGLVHWLGFAVPWKLATSDSLPYTTTAAWGNLELGETGARLVGVAMLLVIVPFLVAAWGVARRASWAVPATVLAAAASLVPVVLDSPAAIVGLVIDVGILVVAGALLVAPGGRRLGAR